MRSVFRLVLALALAGAAGYVCLRGMRLASERDAARGEAEALRARARVAEARIRDSEQRRAEQESRTAAESNRVGEVEARLAAEKNTNDPLRRRLQELISAEVLSRAELDRHAENIRRLRQSLEQATAEAESLKADNTALQGVLERIRQEQGRTNSAATVESEFLRGEVDSLRKQLQSQKERAAKAESRVRELEDEMTRLRGFRKGVGAAGMGKGMGAADGMGRGSKATVGKGINATAP